VNLLVHQTLYSQCWKGSPVAAVKPLPCDHEFMVQVLETTSY
jgi:hypothetical protein